jgi:hypothetical protein
MLIFVWNWSRKSTIVSDFSFILVIGPETNYSWYKSRTYNSLGKIIRMIKFFNDLSFQFVIFVVRIIKMIFSLIKIYSILNAFFIKNFSLIVHQLTVSKKSKVFFIFWLIKFSYDVLIIIIHSLI